MDQKTLEEGGKNTLNFKCEKILHGCEKPIACQTPEKTSEQTTKSKEGTIQLPEKYKAIADLFDRMSCSLRLLRLRKKSPTFRNICTQVEILAKREFSYMHLAQIKYILPEAVHIDKVLVHDNKTLCMKPDLKIALIAEVVQGHSSESTDMALRELFGLRLTDFFNMHPRGTDIPEAPLPEPFQQRTHNLICEDLLVDSSAMVSSSTSSENQQLSKECHPYPLKRHFSKKNVVVETEKIQCFLENQTAPSSQLSNCNCLDNEGNESEGKWQKKCATSCLESDRTINQNMERGQQKESCFECFQPSVINTPAHLICSPKSDSCDGLEGPNIKIASSIDISITETPAQSAPRRLVPSSDDKHQIMTTQNSISCNKSAKRVLDFSHEEGDNNALDISIDTLESSRDAHDNIPEASRECTEGLNASSSVFMPQKVEESHDCSHDNTNQTQGGSATWQHMSLPLLGLVDVIYSIFSSVKCSPITKEELLHKIIMNSLDFVEIREVEEGIEFLEKVVPDWICRKQVPSGDTMYCMKKAWDLDSVRSRLSSNITPELSKGLSFTQI
ncbi:CDT1-like protein a, chloroplastic [Senna tora]|uniref:CDT1-like protein a, chloroplastic n=1 Tax=Senna tora TaxID=362788 RepID=A0A834TFG2_9FABA|nr:CDT1-like protein a, chloroplastic [Senna tora]